MKIPPGAVLIQPAKDFSELKGMHENRPDKHQYYRVSFPFAFTQIHGPMLTAVYSRALHIKPAGSSQGQALCFTEYDKPTPPVWVWTLADERAAQGGAA